MTKKKTSKITTKWTIEPPRNVHVYVDPKFVEELNEKLLKFEKEYMASVMESILELDDQKDS